MILQAIVSFRVQAISNTTIQVSVIDTLYRKTRPKIVARYLKYNRPLTQRPVFGRFWRTADALTPGVMVPQCFHCQYFLGN